MSRTPQTLFLELVSSKYEHSSLVLTRNLPFSRWGDVFSDHVVAAMIDRVVRHADTPPIHRTDGTAN